MTESLVSDPKRFASLFRVAAPYLHAHRGRTFVLHVSGECVASDGFGAIAQDLAILSTLGIRLVLVHGARPQIHARLVQAGVNSEVHGARRVTTLEELRLVLEAVGAVRTQVESVLSMGAANTPMAGARLRVAGGNFVVAQPVGIIDGVDHGATGEVRRVDREGIVQQLDQGSVVLLSSVGFSLTGDVFNVSSVEVASAVARGLGADKLMFLGETEHVAHVETVLGHALPHEMTPEEALELSQALPAEASEVVSMLMCAAKVCDQGVPRVHLVDRQVDGSLLFELFTRDGMALMVSTDPFEGIRPATLEDVGPVLELLAPLAERGVLVRRPREILETEIGQFAVVERDRTILGCAALRWAEVDGVKVAEIYSVAVDPADRGAGRGSKLLAWAEQRAREGGAHRLFARSTQTLQWFRDHGFGRVTVEALPGSWVALADPERNSAVLAKDL